VNSCKTVVSVSEFLQLKSANGTQGNFETLGEWWKLIHFTINVQFLCFLLG
jgi:hypothetical protein